MAVTLTVEALRNALRAGNSDEETTEITRLLGYASAVVDSQVGSTFVPNEVENEAAVRIAAYLYDMPSASRGAAYANVFRNSGAAAMLLPFRTHRAGGIEVQEAGDAPVPAATASGISSAYQFLAVPAIAVPDDLTSADTPVAIPDAGNGPAYALLAPTVFEGPIEPENPFWTVWGGSVHLRMDAGGTLEARLSTTHAFGDKAFTHVRVHRVDVANAASLDLALNVFNSRSVVTLGTYTTPDGTDIEITQADVDRPSRIGYSLEFRLTNRRTAVRKAGNITELAWERPQTTSYQLSLGSSRVSSVSPALALIRNRLNALNDQVSALEQQDALTPEQLASLARIPNPALPGPTEGTRGQFLKQAAGAETYVFDAHPDLPVPASGTRGQFLAQSSTGETFVFSQSQGVSDATARAAADANADRIDVLNRLTTDLHAPPEATGWAQVNADGTQGGLVTIADASTLANLRAATGWAATASRSNAADELAVRVPAGSDARLFRTVLTGTGGQSHNQGLNQLVLYGQSNDGDWDLYWGGELGEAVASAALQVTGSAAHAGESRFDGILGEGADGIRAQLEDVQRRSRDLRLDGAHRYETVTNTDVAAVAAVTILTADQIAIDNGDKALDVQGVTFGTVLNNADFGTASATQTVIPVIRLADDENLSDWRIVYRRQSRDTVFAGGGWTGPLSVANGTAGFSYYLPGAQDRSVATLRKNTEETTYHGFLSEGIVDLDALSTAVAARLLPTGASDKQVAQYNGSNWVAATPVVGGGPASEYTKILDDINLENSEQGGWNRIAQTGAAANAVFDAYVSGDYTHLAFGNAENRATVLNCCIPCLPYDGARRDPPNGKMLQVGVVLSSNTTSSATPLAGYFRVARSSTGAKTAFLALNGKMLVDNTVGGSGRIDIYGVS